MGDMRVLVVEDTDHVREMLTDMLELDGFQVESAGNGFDAVARIDTVSPDVVVIDFKMPGMDGIELAREIRRRRPTQAMILYTAFIDDHLTAAAADAGIAVCLGKVEGLSALGREIRRLCAPLF